jgi:hypothetical protein
MLGLVRLRNTSRSENQPGIIKHFALEQNYPNPFNAPTNIGCEITRRSRVQLKIFDIGGREIITLMDSIQPAGKLNLIWNGADQRGVPVATGTYFCKLIAEHSIQTIKLNLIR